MPATLPQILEKAASAGVGAHRCAVNQLGKRSSLQGRAADQPAVYVRLLEDRPDLPRDLLPHRARVPLLLGPPDADNGQEAGAYGTSGLLRHCLIRFSKDFTPLRVADNDRAGPDI